MESKVKEGDTNDKGKEKNVGQDGLLLIKTSP